MGTERPLDDQADSDIERRSLEITRGRVREKTWGLPPGLERDLGEALEDLADAALDGTLIDEEDDDGE